MIGDARKPLIKTPGHSGIGQRQSSLPVARSRAENAPNWRISPSFPPAVLTKTLEPFAAGRAHGHPKTSDRQITWPSAASMSETARRSDDPKKNRLSPAGSASDSDRKSTRLNSS